MKVGDETIKSKMIFLCTGSRPVVPPIEGLEEVGYLTSRSVLELSRLPETLAIIGGGYIAAEYGHFLSAMGSKVTIVGRNPQFLPDEEAEISAVAKRELQKHLGIVTNHEVRRAEKTSGGMKKLTAVDTDSQREMGVIAEEILVATGRGPNTDILHPKKGGIKVDKRGWIVVDEYLQTTQRNVWALGDANGKHLFKHVANYEARVVYENAVLDRRVKVDYHAVPHAVFTYPEIASVGLKESEAVQKYGKDEILVGIYRYQETAKGEAIDVKDYFAKVIVEAKTVKILGAHIIGPSASVLIQEIIDLMYTPRQSADPILSGMHIHPALNEVVERAFHSLMPVEQYHHVLEHHYTIIS
jgi:dihydrolipoamide dehydrogenase